MTLETDLQMWKRNVGILLIATEIQDDMFRKKVCSKCTKEMKEKRKCEDMGNERIFCDKLVNARKKNKRLSQMELMQTLSSPFLRQSHSLRKIAENLFGLRDS